eukprot:gb/GFBE01040702.1/.p1 GENE.gb/GFBE01040702.1/~~gb/GFBE01040702.1/.p1  ORF type:complete len:336 (+),score=46.03 gb/GFBE01040702.1/:1-1008(+)
MSLPSSGIRRRNVTSSSDKDTGSTGGALASLKYFDVYSKVDDNVVQASKSGGAVTVVTAFIIAILLYSELVTFLSVEMVDSITVDTQTQMRRIPIGLDITFPNLPCEEVIVDNVDSAGDSQNDVHSGLEKSSLEAPAHGAGSGCRVTGKVVVNKVSGNLHIALGTSEVDERGTVQHSIDLAAIRRGFNTSHHIHSISFGEAVPGFKSPLDGTFKVVKGGAFMFHYFVKLVPTVYMDRWGYELYTNQYSVTDSARNVLVKKNELSGLPGVFLVYDFSPFLMTKTEKTKPWSYILTSMCAIIGGAVSIASLVDLVIKSFSYRLFGCTSWSTLPPRAI